MARTLLQTSLQLLPATLKRRIGVHLGVPDLRWSLTQVRRFGFIPSNVLDVGAFRGDWARTCLEVFPDAYITCIEPQDQMQKQLRTLTDKYRNVQVIQTLLGQHINAHVPFEEQGSGSSVLFLRQANSSTKPMTTIDALIREGRCRPPDLIKLDVQGFEVEVLRGWTEGFDQCQVIQCEISLLPLVAGSPLLHDLVAYLYDRDFVMFEVTEVIRAPSDGATWQIDALFCRRDSSLRTERVWRRQ